MQQCDFISYTEPQPYHEMLAQQYEWVQRRHQGECPDTVLLLEHPPTVTLGRKSDAQDFITPQEALTARGVTIVTADRGGQITYHAPGQLVGYPILDLRHHGQDLHRYLRDLEEVIIRVLQRVGLTGERIEGLTGVWVENKKIAAIGIKVSRWISMHGFALNITTDLAPFRQDFIPCGISDRDVTSVQELLPDSGWTRATIEPILIECFSEVFQVMPVFKSAGYNGNHESANNNGCGRTAH